MIEWANNGWIGLYVDRWVGDVESIVEWVGGWVAEWFRSVGLMDWAEFMTSRPPWPSVNRGSVGRHVCLSVCRVLWSVLWLDGSVGRYGRSVRSWGSAGRDGRAAVRSRQSGTGTSTGDRVRRREQRTGRPEPGDRGQGRGPGTGARGKGQGQGSGDRWQWDRDTGDSRGPRRSRGTRETWSPEGTGWPGRTRSTGEQRRHGVHTAFGAQAITHRHEGGQEDTEEHSDH